MVAGASLQATGLISACWSFQLGRLLAAPAYKPRPRAHAPRADLQLAPPLPGTVLAALIRRWGAGVERCQVGVPGPCLSAAVEDPWLSRKCFRPAPTWLRPCGLRALCSASRWCMAARGPVSHGGANRVQQWRPLRRKRIMPKPQNHKLNQKGGSPKRAY